MDVLRETNNNTSAEELNDLLYVAVPKDSEIENKPNEHPPDNGKHKSSGNKSRIANYGQSFRAGGNHFCLFMRASDSLSSGCPYQAWS